MVDVDAETGERDPNSTAREALERYRQTDPSVPLGGLPVKEYERLRNEISRADIDTLTSPETFEVAWVELEHLMSMLRGAVNPETDEPYTAKNISAARDRVRQLISRVVKSDAASTGLRVRARLTLLSMPHHEQIIIHGHKPKMEKQHTDYLRALQQAARELLTADLTPEEHVLADAVALQMVLEEYSIDSAWFLPAAPRQPWHVTAHNVRALPDQSLLIGTEGPEEYTIIDPALLNDELAEIEGGEHPLLQAYVDMPASYSWVKRVVLGGAADVQRYNARRSVIDPLVNTLFDIFSLKLAWQREQVIAATYERAQETAKVVEEPREMFAEAQWYLTDCIDETPLEVLATYVQELEALRRIEGLSPDEQRILGWMQLEHAVAIARQARGDKGQLDLARQRFNDSTDTFERAAKAFNAARMPGNALAALLEFETTAVYRALFTSADPYAVRRMATAYPQLLTELLADIMVNQNKVQGNDGQLAAFMEVVTHTVICLLQSGATEEAARHLVVPAPVRLSSPTLLAFPIDAAGRVATYDTANPVPIEVVDGNEIEVISGRVLLGREAVVAPEDPFALFREILKSAGGGGKKNKSKATKGGKRLPARSAAADELSIRLGDKIFDASEGVDDDIEE